MSKEIKINVKLVDKDISGDIDKIKKKLEKSLNLNIGSGNFAGLEKAIDKLTKAIDSKIKTTENAIKQATARTSSTKPFQGGAQDSTSQNRDKELKDLVEGITSTIASRTNTRGAKIAEAEKVAKAEIKLKERAQKKEQQERKRSLQIEHRQREQFQSQQDKERLQAVEKQEKLKQENAKKLSSEVDNYGSQKLDPSSMNDFTSRQGGGRGTSVGGIAKGALGVAGAAGAVGLGAIGVMTEVESRRNQESLDALSGNFLEAQAREQGRGSLFGIGSGVAAGAGAGMAAGAAAGSFIPGLGTVVGGAIGGIGGAITGGFKGSSMAGELSVEEVRTTQALTRRARDLVPERLETMAGTGLTSDNLNNMQGAGAELGFSPQETLNQIQSLRQSVGTDFANETFRTTETQMGPGTAVETTSNLEQMQRLQRGLGISVGDQAQVAETFAGAEGRGASAEDLQKQIQVLKKGVSLGLDASKSGEFLQKTAQAVASVSDLAKVDTERTSQDFAAIASELGGGDITSTSMRQAQSVMERINAESGTFQGMAGAGNILAAQETFGDLSAPQLMAASTIKATDDVSEISKILGVSEDQARQFQEKIISGEAGLSRISDEAGLGREVGRTLLGSESIGESARFEQGRSAISEQREMDAFRQSNPLIARPQRDGGQIIEDRIQNVTGSTEQGFQRAQAQFDQGAFIEGFKALPAATAAAGEGLNAVRERALEAADALAKLVERIPSGNNNSGSSGSNFGMPSFNPDGTLGTN